MRYSLCSYSFHRTVDAGKRDVFGNNRFCKKVGYTQLDPWNYHIARAYDDNGYLAELKASGADSGLPYWDIPGLIRMLQAAGYQGAWGIESTPDDGDEIGAAEKSLALLKRSLEGAASR